MPHLVLHFLLQCLAVSASDNFFRGCVQESLRNRSSDACVLVPPRWLDAEVYRDLAHLALANGSHFPRAGNRHTVLDITQAANQVSRGIVTRLEFSVLKSSCDSSTSYSKKQCKPVGPEQSGLCQARFRFLHDLKLEDFMCDAEVTENYEAP
ncbi:uncharacterized protein LOC142587073 [Dermacentor variabilis]|uniref:uncharacterized protein LOC142587073 n=1 Tax=Dermacentor variabilis TaxID=34621 RepID=UPI003F5C974A